VHLIDVDVPEVDTTLDALHAAVAAIGELNFDN
jgi:hypothetical protein